MNGYWKTLLTILAAAVMLVGWGVTWANQSARIHANRAEIGTLKEKMDSVTILWIAIPLFIQTNLIFWLGYGLARLMKLSYKDAAPAAMIGASNHFEVAIATSVMLFGLSSGAALATVVGVLVEVPVMLSLVALANNTRHWFADV